MLKSECPAELCSSLNIHSVIHQTRSVGRIIWGQNQGNDIKRMLSLNFEMLYHGNVGNECDLSKHNNPNIQQ